MMTPPPMGAGLLYDVTRLIARRNAATPTGIDRVDLRYAMRAAALHWGPALLVAQLRGRIVEVPRPAGRRLLASLADRWIEGGAGADLDPVLRQAGLVGDAPPPAAVEAAARAVRAFAARHQRCVYLNTSHHGLSNLEMFGELDRHLGGGFVFFVHDLIPIELPEYVRPGDRDEHAARMRTVLSLGATVIANSEATRRSLEHWAAAEGFAPPRSCVARIGVEPRFLTAEQPPGPRQPPPPLPGPYFACVGTIEPRKNHITLLHVWRALARDLPPEEVPKLVLIGRRGWECEHVFAMLDRCEVLRRHVVERSALGDEQMRAHLQGARAVLFPSFAEGWGMPLVEALSLGVPVICSDIPVFREASQGLADFLDPLDGLGWRRRALEYAGEAPDAVAARRARLRGFVPPSWAEHFAIVDQALHARMADPDGRRAGTAAVRPGAWGFLGELPGGGAGPLEAEAEPPFADFAEAVAAGDRERDGRRWAAAAGAYRQALRLRPEDGGIWVQCGHMLKEAGDLKGAYGAYGEALRLLPADADLHLQLGHLFKVAGHLPQALAYYEAAALLNPDDAEASRHLAWAQERRERLALVDG